MGLVEFDGFQFQYRTVIHYIAEKYALYADISEVQMQAAFQQWIFSYFEIVLNKELAERPALLGGFAGPLKPWLSIKS